MRPGFVRARYVSISMYKQIAHLMDLAAFILRHRVGISTALAALAIDQVAKLLVIWTLAIGDSWPVGGLFRLTHVVNTGNTLDLFSGHTTVLIAISVMGIGLLFALYWFRTRTGARAQFTFGLLLAGAGGNLVDRLVLGHVTDFIDVVPWFIFNVADVSILLGLVGFVWDIPEVSGVFRKRVHTGA